MRSNTRETKIRGENDKGRDSRIQRIAQVRVCLENKSSKQETSRMAKRQTDDQKHQNKT